MGARKLAGGVTCWAAALAMLALLLLMGRALWVESARYRVLRVPPVDDSSSRPPPAVTPGHVALLAVTPLHQLRPGDVILFWHPLDRAGPHLMKLGDEMARVPGGTGYLVRLESGDPAREPWHAELHGGAWRVIGSAPFPAVQVPSLSGVRGAGVTAAVVVAAAVLLAARALGRARCAGVARSYRPDLP